MDCGSYLLFKVMNFDMLTVFSLKHGVCFMNDRLYLVIATIRNN